MSTPDVWQRVHALYVKDIYVGLRLDGSGLHAWITDRHYLRKADCHIQKSTGLVMAEDLQRWLEAEGFKMLRGNGIVDYAHNTTDPSLPTREREP
jgi:hypothetical protein